MIFGTFKKFLKFISNRITLTVIALFIQFMFYFLIYWYLTSRYLLANVIMWIVAVVTVLWLTNSRINPGYKLIWTSLILALPLWESSCIFRPENPGWRNCFRRK